MDDSSKNLALWAIITLILIFLFSNFGPSHRQAHGPVSYSNFVKEVSDNKVSAVTMSGRNIEGTFKSGEKFKTVMPMEDQLLLNEMIKQGVDVNSRPEEHRSLLMQIFISWFPMILLIGIWLFIKSA